MNSWINTYRNTFYSPTMIKLRLGWGVIAIAAVLIFRSTGSTFDALQAAIYVVAALILLEGIVLIRQWVGSSPTLSDATREAADADFDRISDTDTPSS